MMRMKCSPPPARPHGLFSGSKTFFFLQFKTGKSVDFKPVESSSETADLPRRLSPSEKRACKRANSEVLDIQAPTFEFGAMSSAWARADGEEEKEEEIVK